MKLPKTYTASGLITSLVAILYMSMGMHLIHPYMHGRHNHGVSAPHRLHENPAAGIIKSHKSCDICLFFSILKVGNEHHHIDDGAKEFLAWDIGTSTHLYSENIYCYLPEPRTPPSSIQVLKYL